MVFEEEDTGSNDMINTIHAAPIFCFFIYFSVHVQGDLFIDIIDLHCCQIPLSCTIYVYWNLLIFSWQSKEECEYLISIAQPHMEKSTVVDSETGKSRDSRYAIAIPSVLWFQVKLNKLHSLLLARVNCLRDLPSLKWIRLIPEVISQCSNHFWYTMLRVTPVAFSLLNFPSILVTMDFL